MIKLNLLFYKKVLFIMIALMIACWKYSHFMFFCFQIKVVVVSLLAFWIAGFSCLHGKDRDFNFEANERKLTNENDLINEERHATPHLYTNNIDQSIVTKESVRIFFFDLAQKIDKSANGNFFLYSKLKRRLPLCQNNIAT